MLALTVILAASAVYDWYRFERTEHGVVVQPEVVARKGNAESYDPAFTEPLKEGTEFRVLERRGTWLQIQLPGGIAGWVPQRGGDHVLSDGRIRLRWNAICGLNHRATSPSSPHAQASEELVGCSDWLYSMADCRVDCPEVTGG